MGKNNPVNPQKKMFFDTIKDMRKLIQKNTNSYTANTLGLGKKNKMPYDHLVGRRNAIKQQYKTQKSRAHQQSIQYDSSMKLLNSGLMKQRKQKDEFQKNQYKFTGASGGFGTERGGFLEINKKEADRIMGKNQRRQERNQSNSKHHGHKKGGAFGKKKKVFGKKKGKGKGRGKK